MTPLPVIPESAPFTLEQRLWLNGFLAGFYSRLGLPQTPPGPLLPAAAAVSVRILFGSQTGTAQSLAGRLGKAAVDRGFQAQVTDAAHHAQVDWTAEKHLLLVTSTYGEGEMPDNAQAFWDWLGTDAANVLRHVHFSVLALGDRNYSEFCGAGKKLDARLEQIGASRLYPRTDCDVDYEAPAEVWIKGVLTALAEGTGPAASRAEPAPARRPVTLDLPSTAAESSRNGQPVANRTFSKERPFPGRLLSNVLLSKPGSSKEVRHYELTLEGSGLTYAPGDAVGVVPANCPELVDHVLLAAQWGGDETVRVGQVEMPLREAFTRHLDITRPSPELLAAVARRVPESDLAALLLPGRQDELKRWLWGRGVIDLLHLLPERLSLSELTPLLKKLAPRLYSIASSPAAHPGEIHLTVSVLRYESYGRRRKGVASTFLADRAGEGECVKLFIQPSARFKLPAKGETPMIMVGPGTGIAPFRSFLEERQVSGAKGRHWLFFGDQRRGTDFLYEEQLTNWLATGHLNRLDLAFSRDQADKLYVQHRMLQQAGELWAWLEEGAHFYVCGDAARMAKDVDAALHQVAESAGGKSADEAKAWVAQLKAEQRYQRDVY